MPATLTVPALFTVASAIVSVQSIALFVSQDYRRLFAEFGAHFESEMEALNDESLDQETAILEKLSRFPCTGLQNRPPQAIDLEIKLR